MATYASYKKLTGEELTDGSVDGADLASPLNTTYGVKWFYGSPGACTPGCCCLWTVPAGVKKLHIQIWGAGGNGSGACSCNRCHHYMGASGGFYNTKTIDTVAVCTYSVCAAGVYRCYSRECNGCRGCSSYVNGYNLSNFCAIGGRRGESQTSWATYCHSQWCCCMNPGNNGGDWMQGTHTPNWDGAEFVYDRGFCHCYNRSHYSGGAALIGTVSQQSLRGCWMRCGCWTVPYGNGAQNAMTTYCERCCGQGGTGGGGLVKITYF